MLDINLIRQNPEEVKKGIASKNADPKLVDDFLVLDNKWRELIKETDNLRAEQKKLSEERKIDEAKELKNKIQNLGADLKRLKLSVGKFYINCRICLWRMRRLVKMKTKILFYAKWAKS